MHLKLVGISRRWRVREPGHGASSLDSAGSSDRLTLPCGTAHLRGHAIGVSRCDARVALQGALSGEGALLRLLAVCILPSDAHAVFLHAPTARRARTLERATYASAFAVLVGSGRAFPVCSQV